MNSPCECGCGEFAGMAKNTDKRFGHIKGKPLRFISGHNLKNNFKERHSRWKGGNADCHGYIYVLMPDHPNVKLSGYIARSKLIAEKVLGKYLPPKAIIHHVNGIRDDDRNENLVVCENARYHYLLHQRQKALKESGNANWLKCVFCKEYDSPENLYLHPHKNSGLHRSCRREYERKSCKNKKP